MKSPLVTYALILPLLGGCGTTPSAGFVDDLELPEGYLGGYRGEDPQCRAWTEGQLVVLEIIREGGVNVGSIEHRVVDDAVYIWPIRISSGGAGIARFTVDLESEDLDPDWTEHVYWQTGGPDNQWAGGGSASFVQGTRRVRLVLESLPNTSVRTGGAAHRR